MPHPNRKKKVNCEVCRKVKTRKKLPDIKRGVETKKQKNPTHYFFGQQEGRDRLLFCQEAITFKCQTVDVLLLLFPEFASGKKSFVSRQNLQVISLFKNIREKNMEQNKGNQLTQCQKL